jgi:hypothetical protein
MINFYGGFCNIHIVFFSVLHLLRWFFFNAEKRKFFLEMYVAQT